MAQRLAPSGQRRRQDGIGDVNGNGAVNASHVSQTKSRVGHTIDGTNSRSDVNADGSINATDVSLVKSSAGTGLP